MPGTPVKKIRYRWKPPYEGPRTPASKIPTTPPSVLPRSPRERPRTPASRLPPAPPSVLPRALEITHTSTQASPAQGPQSQLPGKADFVLPACGTEIPPLPSIQSSDEPHSNTSDPVALIRDSHLLSLALQTESQYSSASSQSQELGDVYLINAEQPVYVNGVLDHANQPHTIGPGLVVSPKTVSAGFGIEVYSGPEIEEYLFGPGHESLDSV